MEIERKYLIHKLPDDLDSYPRKKIQQAYLCTSPRCPYPPSGYRLLPDI